MYEIDKLAFHHSSIPITANALKIRAWEKINIPNGQSGIAVEICLLISHYTMTGSPLTLKTLFYSMEFSEAGIRKQLRYLIKEQWILLLGNSKDKRLKHVLATEKMLNTINNYSSLIKATFNTNEQFHLESQIDKLAHYQINMIKNHNEKFEKAS